MSIIHSQKQLSNIDKTELVRIFYGSQERFKLLKTLSESISKIHNTGNALKFYELSRIDQIKYAYGFVATLLKSKLINFKTGEFPVELTYFVNFEISGAISNLMVRPVIDILCNENQKKKWLPLLETGYIFGAYAQTELGHGSDVQSLETEAVYDAKQKQFIIHSPNNGSLKWWPSELSNISSIAIVFAQTIVNDKHVGVLPFIIQIRDFETHKPLEGVEIGDIGPKLGYQAKENGYLRFVKMRIPLENMPSRFNEITPDGSFIKKGNPKLLYSSMMKSRTALLGMSAGYLGKAISIAIRYSFIRKQFKNQVGKEIPIIQYQLQQYRLFGLLAKTYAMRCSYNHITKIIAKVNLEVQQDNFKNLQEVHILLSGAKAWYTWWCSNGLMVCMNCCGGHGFSQYSGIPRLIEVASPNTILEGDNTILSMQVGSYLLKCLQKITEGNQKDISGYCQYLSDFDVVFSFNLSFDADLSDSQNMIKLWRKSVAAKLNQISIRIIESDASVSINERINRVFAVDLFNVAKLHTILFTYDFFIQYIESISDPQTKHIFLNLASMFIAEQTIENSHILCSVNAISKKQLKEVEKSIISNVAMLYNECLVLADICYFDDATSFSLISHSNEKPYENLYNAAKNFGIMNSIDLSQYYLDTIRRSSLETFGKPKL